MNTNAWIMSKKGVSKIAGNPAPVAGMAYEYIITAWYPATPLPLRNSSLVIWELFKKRHDGKFTSTGIRKKGSGVFTFGEVSTKHTYRLEAYLYHPEGSGPTTIEIRPQPSPIPKISSVDLLHIDASQGSIFSFMDRLIAQARCVNMVGKRILFTLWEDDVAGPGHHPSNRVIDSKEAVVQRDGMATAEFILTKALMKKAMKGEHDPKELEFYVTAEYYTRKKHASGNAEVNSPELLVFEIPGRTRSSQPVSDRLSKAKDSPASAKPASKKEEKGIPEKVSDELKELWDWQEAKGTIKKDRKPAEHGKEGKSVTIVKEEAPIKIEKCLCQQYDLIWGHKIGCNERKKVIEVSKNIGVNPNWLMTVIALETAETFRPSIDNGVGYVGLIQFGKQAAASIGTTQDRLVEMTFVQQMDYVEKHLIPKKAKYKTLTDLYLAVLYPKACGHGSERDYVVLRGDAYRSNPLFFKEKGEWEYVIKINKKGKKIRKKSPVDPNGNTYVWEIGLVAQELYTKGLVMKETGFLCDVSENNSKTDNKCHEDCSQCFEYADVIPNPKINNQSGNVNKNRFHRIPRYNSTHPKGYFHTGTDILSDGKFVEIHSLLCGKVVDTVTAFKSQEYRKNSMGNTVTIKSKDKEGIDVWIIYCHLDRVKVRKGQKIKHGEVIGISGCTGNAGLKPDGSRGIAVKYWHVHIEASRENKFFGSSK